jgi:hypothetical protein
MDPITLTLATVALGRAIYKAAKGKEELEKGGAYVDHVRLKEITFPGREFPEEGRPIARR